MKHNIKNKKLNKTSSHRKAMFMNMSNALIKHEQITTTLAKAKELRRFIEPLITRAKVDSVANRRLIFSKLRHDASVAKLFDEISPRSKDRPGGYLRIIKAGSRPGDQADMAYVELVDREITNPVSPEIETETNS